MPYRMNPTIVTTAWTQIVAAQGKDDDATVRQRCMEYLAEKYWSPVFVYVRRWRRSEDEAEDLTQEYFLVFQQKRFLDQVKRERGRFRGFLFTSLKNFLLNRKRTRLPPPPRQRIQLLIRPRRPLCANGPGLRWRTPRRE